MISQSQKKGLYLVSTPIGNLGDLTIRALEILKNSDLILCEDTRVSIKLLNYYNIKTQLLSFHKFNEKKKSKDIIINLMGGKIISLISDAGTPAISDPGKILVKECINKDIPVIPIPGASSVITSLSISGFQTNLYFMVFRRKKNKLTKGRTSSKINCSIVIFIPPKKLIKNVETLINFLAKKLFFAEKWQNYEEFIRCKVEDLKKIKISDKGELTIVISEVKENINPLGFLSESDKKIIKRMLKNKSIKDIIKIFFYKVIQKKIIYDYCLEVKNDK